MRGERFTAEDRIAEIERAWRAQVAEARRAEVPPVIRAECDSALMRQVERQPQRRGPLLRWARRVRRPRRQPWRPRWLLGLVEVTEYPRLVHYWCVPGYPASCGFPARQPILIPLRGRP